MVGLLELRPTHVGLFGGALFFVLQLRTP